MVTTATDPLRAEPNPAPPRRVWRDWVLVGAVVATSPLEVAFRGDLAWPVVSLAVAYVVAAALLWRRTRPLLSTLISFGLVSVVTIAMLIWPPVDATPLLHSTGVLLLYPYALLRWAVLRDAAIGMMAVLVFLVLGAVVPGTPISEMIAGVVFFAFAAALGASVRYRAASRQQQLDQVRLREREQLARELHDSVAHHVSAIAIRAQGGRLIAETDPARAVEALDAIEEAATRALGEMRAMVGALRESDEVALAPQPGVRDVALLARDSGDWPRVDVALTGHLEDLSPPVGTAVYRLAQESITNALRHARNATRVDVRVEGDDGSVSLLVRDDGDVVPYARNPEGFGLVGMAERAALLGGSFEAGPMNGGGWAVAVVIPKAGAAT